MPSPQKAKGSGYEREVAKFLSDLYGESFIRAPGSGAYVGGKNQARTQFVLLQTAFIILYIHSHKKSILLLVNLA